MADDDVKVEGNEENYEEIDEALALKSDDEGDREGGEDDLEQFLNEHKLNEHLTLLRDQQIDFETLMLLTEPDLKSLNLPLGPYRKLIVALSKKKAELHLDGGNEDSEKTDKNDESTEGGKSIKEDPDLAPLVGEGNSFTVIDESGDDSDNNSLKSDATGKSKKKDESMEFVVDKKHPYWYDHINLKIPDDQKEKIVDLKDPTPVEEKHFDLISDERRLKSLIRSLRKEKAIAVEFKFSETSYVRTMIVFQISTPTADYIIDFIKMNHCIILLTDIFVNPNIVKVFFDARVAVKQLQFQWKLFTVNAYDIRSAVKELKYETHSLYGLINKYVSFVRSTISDCTHRPLKNDVKLSLRKETSYLLHIYHKTKNELLEANALEAVLTLSGRAAAVLYNPKMPRVPENLFTDFKMFNDAQRQASEEINIWRETISKNKNLNPSIVIPVKGFKNMCLCLPTKKEELFAVADTKFVRVHALKLLTILKDARKKYMKDTKDTSKYGLFDIPKIKKKGRAAPDYSLKRKNDGVFARPGGPNSIAKKAKYNRPGKKSFGSNASLNSSGGSPRNAYKRPLGTPKSSSSPFSAPKSASGYRAGAGYQGNKPQQSGGKGYQGNNAQRYQGGSGAVWESGPPRGQGAGQGFSQNQNYTNYGAAGYKYY